MPNKIQTGDSPLGVNGVTGANLSPASGLARIEQEIKKRTPQTGTNVGRWNLPNGIAILPKKTRAVSSETCQLGAIRNDPNNSDKYMITPGFVSGGGGNELVEPDNLTKIEGNAVWLQIAWTCVVVDGVQQAGGTMGTITVATGASIPTDIVPTGAGAATAHIPLGAWDGNGAWIKQGCGSIQVYFCPGGGFFFGRNNEMEV